jgi:hypothetical protein
VTNKGLVAESRSEPGRIVITPSERNVGLLHKVVNRPIATGTSVPAIAGDDQLVDRQISDDPTR